MLFMNKNRCFEILPIYKWDGARKQNDLRVQWRLRPAWSSTRSEQSFRYALTMGSQTPKFFHANIVDANLTAIEAHANILIFRAPAHMLQLLSNSITIFLFDALEQTESTLSSEWTSNGKLLMQHYLKCVYHKWLSGQWNLQEVKALCTLPRAPKMWSYV